ncbi:hypothetical protein GLOTRDRAFT_111677 [Gloeophyllum trabeum ATCC 11539]|uniref:Uncharacterized protein n=1 Tax=Gloeophyllum trabeum (strain ATCC 11539 / FP-39264 / Madison 617) TaxID=670483 RepID=S7Q1R3_GLOTA|nr:uncharacterized protein GLOTRDRAFT_111677 [Gloeophyllum trabeum ATCC 11539]EPQ53472.1 hypothetical protein GLOTRDRAFT_111677 [Gloeophyllum trabeum ATCC 11539]
MADLLAALSLLPPDVNRFSYVAEYLRESFILINPLWVHVLLYVFAVSFAIALILTVVALLAKVKSGEFYLYRFNGGLVIPNAVVLYSIWIGIFIAMMFANLIWQIWCDDKQQPSTNRLALFGCMWFCFWEAGFSYTISTISYTLKVGTSLGTSADAAARWAERKARRDWKVYLVWFVDVIAFVLPLSHVISTWTIFIKSNTKFDNAFQISYDVRKTLTAMAPSYNPETFNVMTDLAPSLAPLTEMQADLDEWIRLSRWGYGLLAFYCFLSLAIWTPFFIILRAQLLQSMGTTTKRQLSNGINSASSDVHVVPERARQRYRTLLWTTATVFLKDVAYGGVALAVGVKPGYVLDPKYNIVCIVLAAGIFSIVGNAIAGLVAWGAVRQLMHDRAPAHTSSVGGKTSSLHFRNHSRAQEMELTNVVKLNLESPMITIEKETYREEKPGLDYKYMSR